jgi:hypothetical protein
VLHGERSSAPGSSVRQRLGQRDFPEQFGQLQCGAGHFGLRQQIHGAKRSSPEFNERPRAELIPRFVEGKTKTLSSQGEQ